MNRPASPHRQRGVALIIALVLVSLATILATKLSFDGWLERRRTLAVLAAEQALHFATGAEALAGDVLSQTPTGGSTQDTLAQPWAQPTQPLPLTPENDAEGEPIGTLQGALEDMQGRFNLNNLAALDGNGKPDVHPFEQFQRLLALAQLEPKWAGIARDWIDADDVPGDGGSDGAEDAVYTAQSPPYRTGNWPMTSATELMNMPGFGADRYRKIAPYVTALPTAGGKLTPINICTAPGAVLDSLMPNMTEYSSNPDLLVSGRKTGCFPDKTTLISVMGGAAAASPIINLIGENTNFFRLTTRVTLGTTEFTLYSLLYRGGGGSSGGKVTVLLRTFGTP